MNIQQPLALNKLCLLFQEPNNSTSSPEHVIHVRLGRLNRYQKESSEYILTSDDFDQIQTWSALMSYANIKLTNATNYYYINTKFWSSILDMIQVKLSSKVL